MPRHTVHKCYYSSCILGSMMWQSHKYSLCEKSWDLTAILANELHVCLHMPQLVVYIKENSDLSHGIVNCNWKHDKFPFLPDVFTYTITMHRSVLEETPWHITDGALWTGSHFSSLVHRPSPTQIFDHLECPDRSKTGNTEVLVQVLCVRSAFNFITCS